MAIDDVLRTDHEYQIADQRDEDLKDDEQEDDAGHSDLAAEVVIRGVHARVLGHLDQRRAHVRHEQRDKARPEERHGDARDRVRGHRSRNGKACSRERVRDNQIKNGVLNKISAQLVLVPMTLTLSLSV